MKFIYLFLDLCMQLNLINLAQTLDRAYKLDLANLQLRNQVLAQAYKGLLLPEEREAETVFFLPTRSFF